MYRGRISFQEGSTRFVCGAYKGFKKGIFNDGWVAGRKQ